MIDYIISLCYWQQGLYMQSGVRPIKSSQLTSSQTWIQEKTNPIKFKSNCSKESKESCTKSKSNSDWIPACTSVSIFGITFGSDVQSRWFKLGWKVNLKGYNFVVYQKSEVWILDLFKGSLGQNSRRPVLGLRAECIESTATSSMTVSFILFV